MTITISDIFQDNMVMQRNAKILLEGKAIPEKNIYVLFKGCQTLVSSKSDGSWAMKIGPFETSAEPESLELGYLENDKNQAERVIKNILIGDVWFGTGQSNMEMGLGMAEMGKEEALKANHPQIRILLLNKTSAPRPVDKIAATWKVCTPETILQEGWDGFSALGYYFSRKLQQQLQIPIGFIQSAFGGSDIHPWIKGEYLNELDSLKTQHNEWVEAEAEYKKDPGKEHPFTSFDDYSNLKGGMLYNAMIHPFIHFPVKGILWYQGETNVGDRELYKEKLKLLAKTLRIHWKAPALPFFIAQIAPWEYGNAEDIPWFWKAQADAADELANSGLVVTLDVGDVKDIHPVKKKPVGERFAALALHKTYGKDTAWQYPQAQRLEQQGETLTALFPDWVKLISKDGLPPRWVTLESQSGESLDVTAVIEGNKLICPLPSEKIKALCYAWNSRAEDINLYTQEDLPVRPFRIEL